MTKNTWRVLPAAALFAVLAAAPPSARASVAAQKGGGASQDAAAVVRAFYADHFARRQCCFNEAGLRRRRRWLTPALYGALLREVRKETPRDEVPYFNGDPFTDSQEEPAGYSVGRASAGAGRARVNVVLRWTDSGQVVARRTLRVELTRAGGVWRIDDIRYPDRQTLRAHLRKSG